MCACECVRPSAGQPDDHEAMVTEMVGQDGNVCGPVGELVVGVIGRAPHPGSFDAYEPKS